MDQTALLSLLQTGGTSNLCGSEEIIYVDAGQSASPIVLQEIDSIHSAEKVRSQSDLKGESEEREICPLTELCTIQVLTISLHDDGPEVNEVTIPDALASSLRFCCKLCEKTCETFKEFDAHVKTHTSQQGENIQDVKRVVSLDHSDYQEDSVDNFVDSFHDDSTEALPVDSTQIEDIAEGLIGLAASPHRQRKSGDCDVENASVEQSEHYVVGPIPPEEVKCYRDMACSVCDSVFTDSDLWEEHIRTVHLVPAPFQCVVCGKELECMPSLRGHVIKVHGKFSQTICEKQWNKRKKNIPGLDTVPCTICLGTGRSNPDELEKCEQIVPESDLSVLKKKQGARTQISCKLCGKILAKDYMRKHLNLHAGIRRHRCQYCDKVFAERAQLKRHISTHTNDKPFKCNICGQNFTAATSLTRHLNIHTGGKRYQCSMCDKEFARQASLFKHAQNHVDIDGGNCSICGQTFTLKQSLMKHLRNVHLKSEPDDLTE